MLRTSDKPTKSRVKALLLGSVFALALGGIVAGETAFIFDNTAQAQNLSQPQTQAVFSFADMVQRVQPAVVSIRVKTDETVGQGDSEAEGLPPGLTPDSPFYDFFKRFGMPGVPGNRNGSPQHRYGMAQFECMDVSNYQVAGSDEQRADLVLAIGILHHLDDDQARALMRTAHAALKPGGRFISLDGTYVDGQSTIARALISRDRGQSIRTPEAYRALGEAEFDKVEARVRTDMLYVPYTHYVMECVR